MGTYFIMPSIFLFASYRRHSSQVGMSWFHYYWDIFIYAWASLAMMLDILARLASYASQISAPRRISFSIEPIIAQIIHAGWMPFDLERIFPLLLQLRRCRERATRTITALLLAASIYFFTSSWLTRQPMPYSFIQLEIFHHRVFSHYRFLIRSWSL